jgi:hypothetical protein
MNKFFLVHFIYGFLCHVPKTAISSAVLGRGVCQTLSDADKTTSFGYCVIFTDVYVKTFIVT